MNTAVSATSAVHDSCGRGLRAPRLKATDANPGKNNKPREASLAGR